MPGDPPVDEDEKEIQDAQDEFEKDMEVWDRVRESGVPSNVHLHLTPEPTALDAAARARPRCACAGMRAHCAQRASRSRARSRGPHDRRYSRGVGSCRAR